MNTIETTSATRSAPRRDSKNLEQLARVERDLREKGAARSKNTDEDELYENVPCTD